MRHAAWLNQDKGDIEDGRDETVPVWLNQDMGDIEDGQDGTVPYG